MVAASYPEDFPLPRRKLALSLHALRLAEAMDKALLKGYSWGVGMGSGKWGVGEQRILQG